MSVLPELDRVDALLIDIDAALIDLYVEMRYIEEWETEDVIRFVQVAYGKGREDALRDPDPASLHRRHGYRIPKRARI